MQLTYGAFQKNISLTQRGGAGAGAGERIPPWPGTLREPGHKILNSFYNLPQAGKGGGER